MRKFAARMASALTLTTLAAACGPGAVNAPPKSQAAAEKEAASSAPKPNMPTDQISNANAVLLSDYIGNIVPLEATMTPSGFVENGYFKNAPPPESLEGAVYGSFGEARDKATGYVDITFDATDAPESIYIPLITGPSSLNLSAYFVDETGSVLGQPADIHGLPLWSLLKVTLPECETCTMFTLRIDDSGTGWGQWIAAGQPQILGEATDEY